MVGKMSLWGNLMPRAQLERIPEDRTGCSATEVSVLKELVSDPASSVGFVPVATPIGSCEIAVPRLPSPLQYCFSRHTDLEYCPRSVSEVFFNFPLLACQKPPQDVKLVGSCNVINCLLIRFFPRIISSYLLNFFSTLHLS